MEYKTEEKLLCVDKLTAGYDGKAIIKDISFKEHNITREGYKSTGQVIAFLGRSGRGKSTLFKALTGLIKPISGKILITDMMSGGEKLSKEICEGDIGFVDQKYTLFRHKTIEKILNYSLRKSKLKDNDKKELVNKCLDEWGLSEHRKKYSCEMSGGQKQRVAIIEQMLSSKHFMILDEPAASLDVGNIEKLKSSIEKISNSNEYNTTIFSTHDISLAVELADSIYILGFPEGTTEYSTIIKHYDLKEMGLAWSQIGQAHYQLTKDIKELLLKS